MAEKGPGGTAAGCVATRGAAAKGLSLDAPPTNQTPPHKKPTGYSDICKLALAKSPGAPSTYSGNMDKTATTATGKKSTARKKTRKGKRRDDSDLEYSPGEDSDDSYEGCKASAIGRRPKISRKKRDVRAILRRSKTTAGAARSARKVAIKFVKNEEVFKTELKTPTKKVSVEQAREATGRSSTAKKTFMALEPEVEGGGNDLSKEPVKETALKRPAPPEECDKVRKIAKTAADSSSRAATDIDMETIVITSFQDGLEDRLLSQGQGVQKPSRPLRQPLWFCLEPEAEAGGSAHFSPLCILVSEPELELATVAGPLPNGYEISVVYGGFVGGGDYVLCRREHVTGLEDLCDVGPPSVIK
ncbi:hypothetical protein HOY80DRAFT_1066844 [Tuber brumale]|nr:hypothetical protein HOY80DRAFT_1066844 [Tuber brumale]